MRRRPKACCPWSSCVDKSTQEKVPWSLCSQDLPLWGHTHKADCVKRDHVLHPLRGLCLPLICGEFSSSPLCFQNEKTKAAGMEGHYGTWCRQSGTSRVWILPYPSQPQLPPFSQGIGSRHSSWKPLLAATEKQTSENANKNWTIISENKYCKYKWWIGERMNDLFSRCQGIHYLISSKGSVCDINTMLFVTPEYTLIIKQ